MNGKSSKVSLMQASKNKQKVYFQSEMEVLDNVPTSKKNIPEKHYKVVM